MSKYLNVQFNFVYCKDQYAYKVFIDEGNIDMGYSRNFNYIDGDTYLNTISYYSSKESFITTKENIINGTMRDTIGVLGFSYNVTGVDRVKYKIYWSAEQMIKDVNNGTINSCIADTTFYNYYHLNRNYNNIVLYGATDTTNLSFVTLKTNKELHNILNKAISYMNDSGKTEELRGIYENVEVNYTFGQFISNNLLTISLVLAGSVLLLAAVIVLIVLLIIKTKKQNKKLKDYNDHDFLTGLFSKSKYEKDLTELIVKNDKFAFYMIDIDNFKVTNDVFGHSVGDQVLIEMANRFRSICNVNVKCYRFAGDEFVITYEYPMKEDVLVLANRLLHLCDNLIVLGNGNKVYTSISFGISLFPLHATNVNDLQVLADVALYYVKTRSKNAYELYDPNKEYSNKNTSDIEFAISKALDNNDIYMVFQPEYDMKKKSITCFEALMRIKDCKYGPGEFIRIAEKNGSIIKLGRIAVVQAVEFAKKLLDNGIDNFTVSFNFSAVQVADIEFMDLLQEVLIKNKFDAKYMNVEMTESVLFSSDKEVKEAIKEFTKLGLSLSLDDFGNGYSSIETLGNYKFNVIKFDKGLIDRMFKNNSIISLISVIHSYGYKVLAEGVETKEQFDYLKEKDCDIIQGYYISRPLDSDATINFVKEFDPKKRDL